MTTSQKQPAKLASTEQILDIQYSIGLALRKMPEAQAKKILSNKKELQKLVGRVCKELQIPVQNERAIAAIPLLENYYKKVFGLDIPEIAEVEFPEHFSLHASMAVSPKLPDEDGMMDAFKEFFSKKKNNGVSDAAFNLGKYMSPVAKKIDRASEALQQRPSGLYVFAHSNEDEPDAKHRNKSYDNAVAEKLTFAKANEYLLIWGYKRFAEGKNMDTQGWTRTASLWSDGDLVGGGWSESYSGLCMSYGDRDCRNASYGPRELFLTL